MNARQRIISSRLTVMLLAVGLVFAFSAPAWAPPRRGGAKPGPKPGAKKAGPKPGVKKARPKAKAGPKAHRAKVKPSKRLKHARHKRIRHKPRYWHRHLVKGRPITTYGVVGYPYYVGGTSYIVGVPSSSGDSLESSEDTAPTISPGQSQVGDEYAQLQELIELIHEWRTINESPEVHERVSAANESAENRGKIESIKKTNQEFDKITRLAMRKVTQGQSVDPQLEAAGKQLDELIELVESLPEAA